MEEHPNVTIMHDSQSTNDLRTKLTVEMAAGNPPDVSWCPVNYAREFIKDGLIIDWKDVIDDPAHPEWKEWFSEATIASLTEEDGTILLAPQEGSIDGLYYNKKMFDENGWKAPATWDDLMNLIPVIKEKEFHLWLQEERTVDLRGWPPLFWLELQVWKIQKSLSWCGFDQLE